MVVDGVIDASVLAAAFFNEEHSEEARTYLRGGQTLVAPDLLRLEVASIAAKKVWRGEASVEASLRAIRAIDDFILGTRSSVDLVDRAFDLAQTHRISAYDAAYLALAELEDAPLITLDDKLIQRAREAGLGQLVRRPAD